MATRNTCGSTRARSRTAATPAAADSVTTPTTNGTFAHTWDQKHSRAWAEDTSSFMSNLRLSKRQTNHSWDTSSLTWIVLMFLSPFLPPSTLNCCFCLWQCGSLKNLSRVKQTSAHRHCIWEWTQETPVYKSVFFSVSENLLSLCHLRLSELPHDGDHTNPQLAAFVTFYCYDWSGSWCHPLKLVDSLNDYSESETEQTQRRTHFVLPLNIEKDNGISQQFSCTNLSLFTDKLMRSCWHVNGFFIFIHVNMSIGLSEKEETCCIFIYI